MIWKKIKQKEKVKWLCERIISFSHSISLKFFVILSTLLILSFGIVIYVNTYFLTSLLYEDMVLNAIQVSNIIKRATYYSMLRNHREDLTNTIISISKEEIFEGIRIYNKIGVVTFSDKKNEIGQIADKVAEQCYVCHAEEPAKGIIPTKDRTRIIIAPEGYRVLGLINPIENEPECFNAACHAHSPKEKLLGILDVKLSLKEGDRKITTTKYKMVIYSALLIVIAALIKGYFTQKMIHTPIKKLVKATKEVANFNLDYKVDINSQDEFGNLAHSFNKMISQLKETNEACLMAERMASMGKLSAMVAHEINNPLSGVLSYAKLSLKLLDQVHLNHGQLEEIKKNLLVISNETKRCGEIVKNLLLFVKQTGGVIKEEKLSTIIENSVRIVEHSAKMNELTLITALDEYNDRLYCDAGGIQQVLIALIINSIEATPRGGKITVETDCRNQDFVTINVTDTGKGISDEILPRIFEPFFTTKAKSTGLGLSIVYRIVEHHGGSIHVKSKINEGTTFTIILPRKPHTMNQQKLSKSYATKE